MGKKKAIKKSKKKIIKKSKKVLKKKERKSRAKIEPNQLLLQARRILIFGTIDQQMASNVINNF